MNSHIMFYIIFFFLSSILLAFSLNNNVQYSRILSIYSISLPLTYWLFGKIKNEAIKNFFSKYGFFYWIPLIILMILLVVYDKVINLITCPEGYQYIVDSFPNIVTTISILANFYIITKPKA